MTEGGKNEARAGRTERLRAALRENLKRRKAQARSRASGQEDAPEARSKPAEGKEKR